MPRRKKLAGEEGFLSLMQGLIAVPKRELDAEVAKEDRRKAAKAAKASTERKPKRAGG